MANQTLGFRCNGDALAAKDNIELAICSLDRGQKYRSIFFGLHATKPNSHRKSRTRSPISTTQLACVAALDSDA
jgi:hypothetical protein